MSLIFIITSLLSGWVTVMKISYKIPFKNEILIDDHWAVPLLGGKLYIVEDSGLAKFVMFVLENQPVDCSPDFKHSSDGVSVATINNRDTVFVFLKHYLKDALAFLECFYNIELDFDSTVANYEAENEAERKIIKIKSLSYSKSARPLPLEFNMFARAVMASITNKGPVFEATLVKYARSSFLNAEYINSFRYSFLLIESLYGEGQFKKNGLQGVLKANDDFRNFVDSAVRNINISSYSKDAKTIKLISGGCDVDGVIDYLIERRGFYFHGNVKRGDAWKPNEQDVADVLAGLTLDIAMSIASASAAAMFQTKYESMYYDNAIYQGAIVMYVIQFKYREPGDDFDREHQMNIRMPGTKVTPGAAFDVAQKFMLDFNARHPASKLMEVHCFNNMTGDSVFDMKFHV